MGKEFSVVLSSNLARISKMTITLSKCVSIAIVNKINSKGSKFYTKIMKSQLFIVENIIQNFFTTDNDNILL